MSEEIILSILLFLFLFGAIINLIDLQKDDYKMGKLSDDYKMGKF